MIGGSKNEDKGVGLIASKHFRNMTSRRVTSSRDLEKIYQHTVTLAYTETGVQIHLETHLGTSNQSERKIIEIICE